MKHTKKLLALVLAMVMAFSLMAVTAAAYSAEEHEHVCSTETIEPRLPAILCPVCETKMIAGSPYTDIRGNRVFDCTCPNGHPSLIGIPYC